MTDIDFLPPQNSTFVTLAPEPLVLTPTGVPESTPLGRKFWTENIRWKLDKNGLPFPWFTVAEVAKTFFGRKSDWLRWRSDGDARHPDGWLFLDGIKVEPMRTDANARRYNLYDIERMANALAQNGVLDGDKLSIVINMVKLCARASGYSLQ